MAHEQIQIPRQQIQMTFEQIQMTRQQIQMTRQQIQMTREQIQMTREQIQIPHQQIQIPFEQIQMTREQIQMTREQTRIPREPVFFLAQRTRRPQSLFCLRKSGINVIASEYRRVCHQSHLNNMERMPMKHIFPLLAILAILIAPSGLYVRAQEQETPLDAETQKLWDAHTVVPKTDDIKELRAFLKYGSDNWMQMNGRIRGEKMWERFRIEKNKATFEAANRIIALSKNEPGEEPPPPQTLADYFGWDEEKDDLTAALYSKIPAYNGARDWNPNWQQEFRDFIGELKKNPAHKKILKFAEASWFNHHFNAAVWPKGVRGDEMTFEESLRLYEENVENVKRYYADNADDPYLKFQIDHHNHQQVAEVLEGRGKLKKGTLVKPVLEYYRDLYEKHPDAHDAKGWLRVIKNDLVKYDILTADDPLAAFQVKVEELKQSLEAELDENSRQKVFGLSQIAEEMDQRNAALRLLLTTVRPIYAASEDEEHNTFDVLGFDIRLRNLALEGVEFELETVLIDGTKINLKDYRGKVVVLDYWHTGCGPCVGDMPTLKTFYKNWHEERGVELIGISADDDLDVLKAFIEKEQLAWPNASEKLSKEQNLPDSREKYNINAWPTTILIDQNGKVVRAGNGLYSVITQIWKLFPVEDGK